RLYGVPDGRDLSLAVEWSFLNPEPGTRDSGLGIRDLRTLGIRDGACGYASTQARERAATALSPHRARMREMRVSGGGAPRTVEKEASASGGGAPRESNKYWDSRCTQHPAPSTKHPAPESGTRNPEKT